MYPLCIGEVVAIQAVPEYRMAGLEQVKLIE